MNLPHPRLFHSAALLCLAALLFTAACTPLPATPAAGTQSSTQAETATPSPTAAPSLVVDPAALAGLNLQVWHAFAGESYAQFTQQVDLFNAVNEWGIIIHPAGYGDYLTLHEAMQSAITSGDLPHMVISLPEQALAWQGADLLADLQVYARDPLYGMPEQAWGDFPAAFLAGVGMPAQRSARFLYYNQTWAQELGFTAAPQTPDEFRQQACAANAAFKADADLQNDGFGGWVVDTHWQSVYAWMLALGGNLVEGQAYTFRTDDNLAALEYLKSLYDDNCAWLSSDAAPYQAFAGRKALFVSGDLAEVQAASLAMSAVENDDAWTLIPFPGQDEPLAIAYGPDYILLRASPEEQLAGWLFIRWLLSPENQALWVEATGLLPLRATVLDLVAPYAGASPQWAHAAADLNLLEPAPGLASWRKARYLLEDGLAHIFQAGLPLEQLPLVLDEMQSMADELGNE
jgi:ABC-type glycerol-3-phosphate transport system substrate-binding protein